VCIKGSLGSIFLCAAYCQFDSETENNRQDEDYSLQSCLAYLDAVLLLASSTPAILGLDANAASPMWFNKLPSHAEGLANYSRGELLSFIFGGNVHVQVLLLNNYLLNKKLYHLFNICFSGCSTSIDFIYFVFIYLKHLSNII